MGVGDEELWTIEQLPDRVAALLAENYDGQRSGRVRELPNGRAIRWYTTIGLVDRPAASRGRTALYGRRHLLQVVAVKKLQAAGYTLAQIQAMMVGASDRRLAELAGLTRADGPVEDGVAPPAPPRGEGFWRDRPAAPPVEAAAAAGAARAAVPVSGVRRPEGEAAGEASVVADSPGADSPGLDSRGAEASAAESSGVGFSAAGVAAAGAVAAGSGVAGSGLAGSGAVRVVPSLRLGDRATLVLDTATRVPTTAELAAIEAAAAPLLDLLARTGLAPTTGEDNG